MAHATEDATYAAIKSPYSPHAGIQIDFPTEPANGTVIEGSGNDSGYDKVMYGHDLVMIFPRREGGEVKKPGKFTVDAFVTLFMGKDHERSKRKNEIVVDTFQRVFRTARCYLDDQGHALIKHDEADHTVKAEQELWREEERLLIAEYERFVGSKDPTTELQYCELVAITVARRIQLACGLTTRMFRSCDDDEIILTIKADDNDLRVEADRTDYLLQVSNKPFDASVHGDKMEAVKREIGEEEWRKSVEHLRRVRGCAADTPDMPEMDPLLVSDGKTFQPRMLDALQKWGHTEEADGKFINDDSCRPSRAFTMTGRMFNALLAISYDPRTYFSPFADYRHEAMYQPYYRRYPVKWGDTKEETLFTQKDRIRLAGSILFRHINTDALVAADSLVGNMFALHDEVALKDLRSSWALRWGMLNQPLHKIRYYFGEKVGLYFAWLGFYTKMLVFPALFGIITFAVVESRENMVDDEGKELNQGYILIVFAVFVVIWSSLFAEMWKRKNHVFNALWGVHGYHSTLHYRAQFRGTKSYNPVTDEEEMTIESKSKRRRAFVVSILVVLMMIIVVLVALLGLFYVKYYINSDDNGKPHVSDEYRSTLTLATTAANAIQILILNMVYREVARKLNDYENHRTDREYENFLIIKVFLFQFCNSFASFFYIAFLKRTVENECINDDCMTELQSQLLVLFIIRIVVGNTLEVVIPYLKYRFQLYLERKSVDKKARHNYIEEQAKLVPYEQDEAFEDYNEMVIQFGFINLFVVAFPLTPLLALLNNLAEVHVDAIKLCYVHRRPYPHAAKNIGAWFYILRFMAYIALGTNAALILWTSDLFPEESYSSTTKWFAFLIAVLVCIMVAAFIERTVSDMPVQLRLFLERSDHIVAMVFKNLFTGDDSHLGETAEDLDLNIYPNEQWDDRTDVTAAKVKSS